MGYGRINVWVRERDCCVAKMSGRAWATCCCTQEIVADEPLVNGHSELKVPPGTYIVDAGWPPGCCGTAKETIAVVGCEQTVCVNLIREWAGDPISRVVAFSAHAGEAGMSAKKAEELVDTLTALAKTVPKERIKFYSPEELKIRRKFSDAEHKQILTKYRRVLLGKGFK